MSSPHLRSAVDTPVALGLGANLGNPRATLAAACHRLAAGGLRELRCSSFHLTAPVDCVPGTPPFLNAAVTGRWDDSPQRLLELCQRIERDLGRPAVHSSREARVLDLDLLLAGTLEVRSPQLVLPHPRLRLRRFVLAPLAELAAAWPVPPDGATVGALLAQLPPEPAPEGGAPVQSLQLT